MSAPVIQCDSCGRILTATGWVRDMSVIPSGVGMCPPCDEYQHKRAEYRRQRAARDLERRAGKGQLRAKLPADPFESFRDGE